MDVDTWVDLFTSDAVIMPANDETVVGRSAIEAWERQFANFKVDGKVSIEDLFISGDIAVLRTRTTGSFTKDGKTYPINGKELAILHRRDGQWKYFRICGNRNKGERFEGHP